MGGRSPIELTVKSYITIAFLLFVVSENATAAEIYGPDGSYLGWFEGGDIYSSDDGCYQGYIENTGDIYGNDGSYEGWVVRN